MSRWADHVYVSRMWLAWFLMSPWNRADAFYAARKWISSFFKSEWRLEDYPVRVKFQRQDEPTDPPCVASIVYWRQLNGFGETKAAAVEDLRSRFSAVKMNYPLPRPGSRVHIQFGMERPVVNRHWKIANAVIVAAMGPNHPNVAVTDESTLKELCGDDLRACQARLREQFGIDASRIVDGNIARIVQLIVESQAGKT